MSDVHDSLLYKNIAQNQGCKVLTFNFNTDGFPIFKSSKNSIWPLSLIINEMPPKCRFQTLILASLWVSKSEPKPKFMNLYLKFFIQQMEKLMNDGITVLNSNNEKIKFVLRPLSASVDSVARPIIQNRIQFNGYYGCSWCYDKGVYAHGSMRYPFTESESLRSHENYLKDINEAKRMQRPINGVKGASILTTFKHFDCVWGFPVDYLHGILGGVVRQLWTEWNCPSSPFYLSRKQRQKVDERLLNIKPPQEIHRLPRSFNEGKLKASEWRSWLLFYSVPCLTEILNDKALASFTRLVRSVYILLSQNISEENFKQCENDLIQFVGESEILYGKSVMTFNMHTLLHVVDSVRMSGPLWATSTFPYENDNFHLKQNVSGPNGVLHQIATKTLQRSRLKNAVINENKTDTCTIYCQGLFNPRKLVMQNTITVCGAVLIGEITAQCMNGPKEVMILSFNFNRLL
ncbi:uncharacterized protein [Temnothorax nylanderi]|uniref:uncharacterized protein n=1 Tax=Temnothorax nylanderi TaxID=102681 RepID=UPI003A871C8D